MCYLKFGVLFISVVLAGSASSLDIERNDNFKFGDKCTPGKAFHNLCNVCVCSENGDVAACTNMFCVEYYGVGKQRSKRSTEEITARLEKESPRVSHYNFGDKCPASAFYNDCNLCICGEDGVSAACTLKYCGYKEAKKVVQPSAGIFRIKHFSQGVFCAANQKFNDGCNTCYCSANGLSAACTLKVCPEEEEELRNGAGDAARRPSAKSILRAVEETFDFPHIDDYKYGDSCPAGEPFFNQCNVCHCGADGSFAACTLAYCSSELLQRSATVSLESIFDWPHIDNYNVSEPCPAGKMFFDRCNICKCNGHGDAALCTAMSCDFMKQQGSDDLASA